MSIRSTLVMVVLVALLGSLYWFRDKVRAPEDDKERPALTSTLKGADVSSVDLVVGGKSLSFEKKDGVWLVKAPYKGLAATKTVQNFVNALADMHADRIVTDDTSGKALEQYGLDKPQMKATLHGPDAKTLNVAVGLRSPTETGWYMRVDDAGPVLLGGNAIAADILRQADTWREGAPLPVDAARIDRISASGDGKDVELSKAKDKAEWSMTKPVASRAEGASITAFLNKFQTVAVKKYFDDVPPDDKRLKALYTLKIWNEGDRDPAELVVGEKTEGGWYAARTVAGQRDVFLLPENQLATLELDATEIADKHLYAGLEVDKAAHVKIVDAVAGEASADKSGGLWSFSKPAAAKDEMGKVTALLYTMKDLKYEHRVSDASALAAAKASLEKPGDRFEITDDKGTVLATLTVGGETPTHRRYVKTTGDNVYTADASFVNDWKTNIEAIRKGAAASPTTGASPSATGASPSATGGSPSVAPSAAPAR